MLNKIPPADKGMDLGSVSYLDCLMFLAFLIPQLLWQVGFFTTTIFVVQALPFLLVQLPISFIRQRYFTSRVRQAPFVQISSGFQDFVVRCVRYAFANMPPSIGRVFLSKEVALPFLWFRLLRHGYLSPPYPWKEIKHRDFKGILIAADVDSSLDTLVYYCHGGGFCMGSSYFYLEFLLTWVHLLRQSGYHNPAILALEYTLVPDTTYPTQVWQTYAGYLHALSLFPTPDPSRICVAGDSAGAALVLSLLQRIGDSGKATLRPGLAVLISPWTKLVSGGTANTASDYIDADTLNRYGAQYVGAAADPADPAVSPGMCRDVRRWASAAPGKGWVCWIGAEEVLAGDARELVRVLEKTGVPVRVKDEEGLVHAWPVAAIFLGEGRAERFRPLRGIVADMIELDGRVAGVAKEVRSGGVVEMAKRSTVVIPGGRDWVEYRDAWWKA